MATPEKKKEEVSPEKYQAVVRDQAALMERFSKQQEQLESLQRENTDGKRKLCIVNLVEKYQHTELVNAAELEKECLFSDGSKFTDEQFHAHLATVERYAQRALPRHEAIPSGNMPYNVSQTDAEKYQAKVHERALNLATSFNTNPKNSGNLMTYQDAVAKAKAEITN